MSLEDDSWNFQQLTCKIAVQFSHNVTRVADITSIDPFIHNGVGFNCKLIVSPVCNLIG